jgi:hypothetical protein
VADKNKRKWINETTNTFAGITTPPDQADRAAAEPLHEAVEQAMDRIEDDLFGERQD